jgi:hypothetical protein
MTDRSGQDCSAGRGLRSFASHRQKGTAVMRTLYDGTLPIEFSQFYFTTDAQPVDSYCSAVSDLVRVFGGHFDESRGKPARSLLCFRTATPYGKVGVRVMVADGKSDPDASWEDVVEVPWEAGENTVLVKWGIGEHHPLEISPGSYRIRYAARGRDKVDEPLDNGAGEQEPVEHIDIVLWPAQRSADRVVRITSRERLSHL